MQRELRRNITVLLVAVLATIWSAGAVFATTSNSTNYQVTETQFNAGMNLESCSGQYCAQTSIGDMAVGRGESPQSTAEFGSITPSEPMLEVIVDPGESNLGVLTTERTATKTMVVKIRSYLSAGYVLQVVGDAPKYGDHSLHTPQEPVQSQVGSEQFALNAAANTMPAVGSNLVHTPSNQTSFGEVSEPYASPNFFKYTSGDVIGRSLVESGQTDYTISMIVNISNRTPAGRYEGEFSAVVVPFY